MDTIEGAEVNTDRHQKAPEIKQSVIWEDLDWNSLWVIYQVAYAAPQTLPSKI